MISPLPTREATALAKVFRPRWPQWLLSWATFAAAAVVSGVHTNAPTPQCTPSAPCQPELIPTLAAGLLFGAAFAGFLQGRVTVWLAAGFAVADLASYVLYPTPSFPLTLFAVNIGFVVVCGALAQVGRVKRLPPSSLTWLATQRTERPPAPPPLPRLGHAWRLVAGACGLLAVGLALWSWYVQTNMDERQANATQVTAEVVAGWDDFTVKVRIPNGEVAKVTVMDAQEHPIGQRVQLYVDDQGLRQLVSEPYDATGWLGLAVIIAGLGLATWAHGEERTSARRRLFSNEQPVTQVYVRRGLGRFAVYPGDARLGEPATAELRFRIAEADPILDTNVDGHNVLSPQPALLYGVPAPGRWCTVVIDGVPTVPTRPLPQRFVAPPFTPPTVDGSPESLSAEHDDAASTGANVSPSADPSAAGFGGPAQRGDLPLRAEEIEALDPIDQDPNPYQVRTHTPNAWYGYLMVVTMPFVLTAPLGLFPPVPQRWAFVIAAVAVGLSSAIAWPMFLRPRAAWNHGGVAVVGVLGKARLSWWEVTRIKRDRDNITIHVADHGFVLPVWRGLGHQTRNAEQLANALRYARQRAMSNTDRDDVDPPRLSVPRPPRLLYLVWLASTPVVGWLFHVFSGW